MPAVSAEVQILGKTYSIRSDQDPQFMTETADYLNMKMRELSGKAGTIPSEKVAVLTAMNLAGELLKLRKQHDKIRKEIKAKTEKLIHLIDKKNYKAS